MRTVIFPKQQLIVILALSSIVGIALACNGGYKVKIRKLQNCAGDDGVIMVQENFTAVLTKKCEVKTRGCVIIKPFKSGMAKFTVKKDGQIIYRGKENICERTRNARRDEIINPILKTFRIPDKCPVAGAILCTEPSQALSVDQYKDFLPLAVGVIDIYAEVQHDTGKSCVKLQLEIAR